MTASRHSFLDQLLIAADEALRTLSGAASRLHRRIASAG